MKGAPAIVVPTPMSMHISLDQKYEYAVVVQAEGIDNVPVARGAS